jgi:hypothetical protein
MKYPFWGQMLRLGAQPAAMPAGARPPVRPEFFRNENLASELQDPGYLG